MTTKEKITKIREDTCKIGKGLNVLLPLWRRCRELMLVKEKPTLCNLSGECDCKWVNDVSDDSLFIQW